jgi:hypothetical protein
MTPNAKVSMMNLLAVELTTHSPETAQANGYPRLINLTSFNQRKGVGHNILSIVYLPRTHHIPLGGIEAQPCFLLPLQI